jgi:hypothetical protein
MPTSPIRVRDVLYLLVKTLWPSSQSSWLQIQRSGFDSWRYQIFWEAMGLKRGPLSLVSTIEEVLERKSSGSGLEIREHGRRDPSRCPRRTFYPQMFAIISPTSGVRSVGIVRSRTQATEFFSKGNFNFRYADKNLSLVFQSLSVHFTERTVPAHTMSR